MPTLSAQLVIAPERLINSLAYSHFELLVSLNEPLKRAFYEVKYICGNWSVRTKARMREAEVPVYSATVSASVVSVSEPGTALAQYHALASGQDGASRSQSDKSSRCCVAFGAPAVFRIAK